MSDKSEVKPEPKPPQPARRAPTPLHGLPTARKLSQHKQLNAIGEEVERLHAIIHGEDGKGGIIGALNTEASRVNHLLVWRGAFERALIEYGHVHIEPSKGRLRLWLIRLVMLFTASLTKAKLHQYFQQRVEEIRVEQAEQQAAAKNTEAKILPKAEL